jgi:hypothetical protein
MVLCEHCNKICDGYVQEWLVGMGILELQVCQVLQDREGRQVRRDDMVSLEILDHLDLRVLLERHWDMMQQHWQPC